MHKAIRLRVDLEVSGEQPAAENFARVAREHVRAVLRDELHAGLEPLAITVMNIAEVDSEGGET